MVNVRLAGFANVNGRALCTCAAAGPLGTDATPSMHVAGVDETFVSTKNGCPKLIFVTRYVPGDNAICVNATSWLRVRSAVNESNRNRISFDPKTAAVAG